MARVLPLDLNGSPTRWISFEEAITYQAKEMVGWSIGDIIAIFKGGYNRLTGTRSELSTKSIIAIKGTDYNQEKFYPKLTNSSLFARDKGVCAYCVKKFKYKDLSCDHVKPVHLGGKTIWTNVVTSCKRCNTQKGGRTLENSGFVLNYYPYTPNKYEHLILLNRKILDDQMDYLISKVPKHSRLRC